MVLTGPQRGEIWWGEPPGQKGRPYLVMTRTSAIPVLSGLVVAAVTRSVRGISTELGLGRDDGMTVDCVASFDNLRLVRRAHLTSRICTLGPDRMAEACDALRAAVDC